MAATTIKVEFDGYWRDVDRGSVPAGSGVYCVYEASFEAQKNTVSLKRLIYIGESGDVRERLANHDGRDDWSDYVRPGNELCYSFGPVDASVRVRAEAALIFHHKPPANTEYTKNFPFDQTTMQLSGKIALLTALFTVQRTP